MNPRPLSAVMLSLVLIGGCGDSSTPTSPTPTATSPVTITWTTLIGPQGTVSRSLALPSAGTIKLTLTSTSPSDVVLGLSVGIPRATAAGCYPARTVQTTAGNTPQIEIGAGSGAYCVQVHDLGTLTNPISFSITIEHP